MSETINSLLQKAERALERDETVVALLRLEAVHAIEPLPGVKSKLAYCIARERRQYKQARALCLEALHADPSNPDHYYQLSRIHLLTGKKQAALKTLRKGLKFKRHQPIIDELIDSAFAKRLTLLLCPASTFSIEASAFCSQSSVRAEFFLARQVKSCTRLTDRLSSPTSYSLIIMYNTTYLFTLRQPLSPD